MKLLDFIIIGAQKSATTSLFRYLTEHEAIVMPIAKEAPFYSDDSLYEEGWDVFASREFPNATESALWGTASPQYMSDERAAKRIAAHNPTTKIIAILRNPIDRAYSHYEMAVRRGLEDRSFNQVVTDLTCANTSVDQSTEPVSSHRNGYRQNTVEANLYLAWSEYGRILASYRKAFPRKQIKIVFMDHLEKDPKQCVAEILEFLGLDRTSVPGNVGKVYHRGGTQRIIPESVKSKVKQLPFFLNLWHCVSPRIRGSLNYWYEQANVRRTAAPTITKEDRLRLVRYFKNDVDSLKDIVELNVPWPEFVQY